MKLELGIIPINDIQFGAESKVENGTIYVNADELKALILEDENLKSVELDIARPGESVRIMPVKDVIEPRVKAVSYTHLDVYKRQPRDGPGH